MRKGNAKRSDIWEWATILGSMAMAVALSRLLGLEAKWKDAIVYTVMLFTVVAFALRLAWGCGVFWRNFLALIVLHVIVVIGGVQAIPFAYVIPKLLFIPVGMVEAVLIIAVLWKRTARARSQRDDFL
jgi:hypothetical protein